MVMQMQDALMMPVLVLVLVLALVPVPVLVLVPIQMPIQMHRIPHSGARLALYHNQTLLRRTKRAGIVYCIYRVRAWWNTSSTTAATTPLPTSAAVSRSILTQLPGIVLATDTFKARWSPSTKHKITSGSCNVAIYATGIGLRAQPLQSIAMHHLPKVSYIDMSQAKWPQQQSSSTAWYDLMRILAATEDLAIYPFSAGNDGSLQARQPYVCLPFFALLNTPSHHTHSCVPLEEARLSPRHMLT